MLEAFSDHSGIVLPLAGTFQGISAKFGMFFFSGYLAEVAGFVILLVREWLFCVAGPMICDVLGLAILL